MIFMTDTPTVCRACPMLQSESKALVIQHYSRTTNTIITAADIAYPSNTVTHMVDGDRLIHEYEGFTHHHGGMVASKLQLLTLFRSCSHRLFRGWQYNGQIPTPSDRLLSFQCLGQCGALARPVVSTPSFCGFCVISHPPSIEPTARNHQRVGKGMRTGFVPDLTTWESWLDPEENPSCRKAVPPHPVSLL